MRMTISSDLFEAFLKCPTKCWLRATGEPGSGNAYAEWVKLQTASYVATQTERLLSETPEDQSAVSPGRENFKTGKWRLATGMIVQALLSSCALESELHAVERVPSEGRGGPAQFIPIRFIFTNKLSKDDKLLRGFDRLETWPLCQGRSNSRRRLPLLAPTLRSTCIRSSPCSATFTEFPCHNQGCRPK